MGAHGPPMRTSPDRIAGVHAEMANRGAQLARLGDRIAELSARIQAATYELLVLIRPIRWMVGTLITRTAAAMLDVALAGTAAHVERIARAWRRI